MKKKRRKRKEGRKERKKKGRENVKGLQVGGRKTWKAPIMSILVVLHH